MYAFILKFDKICTFLIIPFIVQYFKNISNKLSYILIVVHVLTEKNRGIIIYNRENITVMVICFSTACVTGN